MLGRVMKNEVLIRNCCDLMHMKSSQVFEVLPGILGVVESGWERDMLLPCDDLRGGVC